VLDTGSPPTSPAWSAEDAHQLDALAELLLALSDRSETPSPEEVVNSCLHFDPIQTEQRPG
jgi:hypothetical protein